jgi:hypothetical protein
MIRVGMLITSSVSLPKQLAALKELLSFKPAILKQLYHPLERRRVMDDGEADVLHLPEFIHFMHGEPL